MAGHNKNTNRVGKKGREIIRMRAEGKTMKEIGEAVGISAPAVCKRLQSPLFKFLLEGAYNKAGISDQYLADKTKELIDARRVVYNDTGESQEVIDFAARAKGLEIAHKVRGDYAKSEQPASSNASATVNVVVPRPQITRQEWLEIHGLPKG